MAGRIIRVPGTFSASLPQLVTYDYERVRQQILRLPSLQAFYDMSDGGTMTLETGNRVAQVRDLGPRALHLTATGTDRPTFIDGSVPGSFGGVYFDGTQRLTNAALFSGNSRQSIMAGLYATGLTDATSRIFITDAGTGGQNFFSTQTQLRAFSSAIALNISAVNTRHFAPALSYDAISGGANLFANYGSAAFNDVDAALAAGAWSGKGNVGAWNDGVTTNGYIGYMTWLVILNEDVAVNAAVKSTLDLYFTRRYRL